MALYHITGNDRRIYGPVTVEQLRLWLAEGRLNASTLILAEGSLQWKPLSAFPELIGLAGIPPTITLPLPPKAPDTGSGMATAGLVFGILSICTCCFGIFFSILGIIFSSIALSQPQHKSRGQAQAGLILSICGLLIHFIAPFLFAMFLASAGLAENWPIFN